MGSGLFDLAALNLEQHSSLDQLQARGTLRIALKEGGLDAKALTAEQLGIVLERVLPRELTMRGVEDAAGVCASVMAAIKDSAAAAEATKPSGNVYDVFRRLGGD